MIKIINKQRKIKINEKILKGKILKMLRVVGYGDFDIGIWLTTNATIRSYNKKYRKKDEVTDILSFPYYYDLKPGQKITLNKHREKNLGDILISLERVKKDALQMGCSFLDQLTLLFAHGILHLLGHTHQTEKDYKKMLNMECKLLSLFNLHFH